MKRIERLKNMNTEEFAKWICNFRLCEVCSEIFEDEREVDKCFTCYNDDEEFELYVKWLEQEVE